MRIAIAVFVVLALGFASRLRGETPNVLLVMSDDHSAAHVGCYGNADIKTPNLDSFAKQGVRFEKYYVACPQCVPNRAAVLTGRNPLSVQMTRFSAALPAEYKIFPEILKEKAGYYAGVAGRTYHLDGSAQPPETKVVFDKYHLRTFANRLDFAKTAGTRDAILAQYREFLDAVPKGKPFVLQLCFSDPHRPLDKNAIPEPHDPTKLKLPPFYPDTKLVREDFARYYDEISRFDGDFGTVLAELAKRGLDKNTIVLVAGDNGASQFRGKGTLNEFGVHCPLIVRLPHGREGLKESYSHLISGEDLAPTILEAAGVDVPNEMTGKSFFPLLHRQPYEPRAFTFAERGAHGSGLPQNSAAFDIGRCVVSNTHKLIYNVLWQLPYSPVDFAGDEMWKELVALNADGKLPAEIAKFYFTPTRPMFELYDLANDPHELKNLAGTKEVVVVEKELKAALQEWMILNRDFAPLPVPPPGKAKK